MSHPTLGADGVYYAGYRPVTRAPGRWRQGTAWAGRALRTAFGWAGRAGKRAITSLPWVAGGPRPSQVNVENAISLIPLFACIRLLADNVASLPLQTFKQVGERREKQTFVPQLLWQPASRDNLFEWLHKCVVSMALRGNAYGLIVGRDSFGFPTQIEWMSPDDVYVDELNPQRPIYYWRGFRIPLEDVFHIPWFVLPGKVVGLSPIAAFANTIGVGLSATQYGRSWFDNGGTPPAVMRNQDQTVNPAQAEEISDRLAARMRSGKPLVTGKDWEYTPIRVNPEESQFIQTMKLNATQIAAIFGIPPGDVGGEIANSLTYNTEEMNLIKLAQTTLRPWLVRLETAISLLMPVRTYVKFNVDALIRTDLKTRYEAHALALASGWRNVDETRAIEDLPPLPNGAGQVYRPIGAPNMTQDPASEPPATPRGIPGVPFQPEHVNGHNGHPALTGKQGVDSV